MNEKKDDFTVIIPTLREDIQYPSFLNRYKVILSNSKGRSKGRNDGALKAKTKFLLFIDDDTDFTVSTFSDYVLKTLHNKPLSAVCMESIVFSSRIMALSKNLFFKLKGFDETLNFAEDMDLGYRLIEGGYKISYIPMKLIIHKEHPRPSRFSNALRSYVNAVRFLVRYNKIILYDRSIKKTELVEGSIWNILKMCVNAPRRGLLIPFRILITIFGLFYYILFDEMKLMDVE